MSSQRFYVTLQRKKERKRTETPTTLSTHDIQAHEIVNSWRPSRGAQKAHNVKGHDKLPYISSRMYGSVFFGGWAKSHYPHLYFSINLLISISKIYFPGVTPFAFVKYLLNVDCELKPLA